MIASQLYVCNVAAALLMACGALMHLPVHGGQCAASCCDHQSDCCCVTHDIKSLGNQKSVLQPTTNECGPVLCGLKQHQEDVSPGKLPDVLVLDPDHVCSMSSPEPA